ncbi:adenosine deaminase [Nocardioides sp.]|uniref:adenosine deaminase n=1 Tax=Nocardioides sp. TaxID=35761 RepID=UPI002733367D|nr:adenosine deaminase [Nocardioides sp.]MDP3893965.1 adenosine deaminase [Nocardioides sp.]
MTDLSRFIAGLPKAELHVHHVGSASPRIVAELAERHPGTVPSDPEELRAFFEFSDFAHFVEVYLAVVGLIRTAEDVRLLTYEIAREMAQGQSLRYAELTCTPYTSVLAGTPIEAFTEAIEDARVAAERDFGLALRWIYDIPGEAGLPAADTTLAYALDHGPDALVGFGLGGPEVGVPRPQFQPHFDAARAAGLRSVPHAGETTGPQTVWDAVRLLGAERIGHGTSAAQDPLLLQHLAEQGITLEVCPSSNLATRAVASLAEHPLRTFVEAGVPVTINSDDPPMFGTTLNREYEIAADLLGLDAAGVAALATAAIDASFAPDDVRARVRAEIEEYAASTAE